LLPVLWGSQLRQERLDELINLNVLNMDHLPGAKNSSLGSTNYAPGSPTPLESEVELDTQEPKITSLKINNRPALDVLVIGGGLSGLIAGWRVASHRKRVRVAAKGWGATHWGSGCIDVLGYAPSESITPVESPASAIDKMIAENPEHPYGLAGLDKIDQALCDFQELCAQSEYPLIGSLEHNWLLPSATGAMRPTCLAPMSMVAGDLKDPTKMLLVGFQGYPDFYPELAAANLRAQGVPAQGITIDIPSLRDHHTVNTMVLSREFDKPEFRREVIEVIKRQLGDIQRVGIPAVLGLDFPLEAFHDLEDNFGCRVFEIPTIPPSIPGIRLHNILVKTIRQAKGRVNNGMEIISASATNGRVFQVESEAAARRYSQRASNFILATGGFLGGGFTARYDGQITENVFNLPVPALQHPAQWFTRDFLSPLGHPIFKSGLQVNQAFQPVDAGKDVLYDNLYAVGSTLNHGDFVRQRALEGVALVTGYIAGERVGKG
jgi:glycerol-3-phosphate dehydrogenase subunit B